MQLFTIGFTRSTAQHFFARLQEAGVKKLIDVRLNNNSQLSGFAKRDDLAYFCTSLLQIPYVSCPELAPTPDLLQAYRRTRDWPGYAAAYEELLEARHAEKLLMAKDFAGACLLCSEAAPHQCHRLLAAAFLSRRWGGAEIVHL